MIFILAFLPSGKILFVGCGPLCDLSSKLYLPCLPFLFLYCVYLPGHDWGYYKQSYYPCKRKWKYVLLVVKRAAFVPTIAFRKEQK